MRAPTSTDRKFPKARSLAAIVPPGTPAWITAELIEQTLEVWQPHYEYVLTSQDAVTMIQTVGQMFSILSHPDP